MKNVMYHIYAIVFGIIFGISYYLMMSYSIPKHVNCSFSANIWTDIIASIFGCILIYYGIFVYDNLILTLMGTGIIIERICQFLFNKL